MSTTDNKPIKQLATKASGALWWYFLLRGLLVLGVGIYFLVRPEMSAAALAKVIGFMAIIDGWKCVWSGVLTTTASICFSIESNMRRKS